MKPKIIVTDKIHASAVDIMRQFADVDVELDLSKDELIEKIPKYQGIAVRSSTKVTGDVISAGGNLKIIARAGVGLDNIDLEAAGKRDIKVVNAPESLTLAVCELVFGLLLSLVRNIASADRSMRQNRWEKSRFLGTELYGKTMGLVGFGRIGREVALRARAFGMSTLVYDPYITDEDAEEFYAKMVQVDELLKNSDFVSLHTPLTEKTEKFMNSEKISLMKKTAVLINTSRGGVVDQGALIEALKKGKIAGAALDVYETEPPGESELYGMDNVVLTPHIGASSQEAQSKAGTIVAEKMRNFFSETG